MLLGREVAFIDFSTEENEAQSDEKQKMLLGRVTLDKDGNLGLGYTRAGNFTFATTALGLGVAARSSFWAASWQSPR